MGLWERQISGASLNRNRLALAMLVTALLTVVSLRTPLGRDQAEAALNAVYLLDGNVPYRDIWSTYAPGWFFLYALAFKLGNVSSETIHCLDLIYRLLTLWVFFKVSSYLHGEKTGFVAAFVYGAISTLKWNGYLDSAHGDTFAVLPAVLALYFFFKARQSDKWWLWSLSGVFGALASCVKFEAITAYLGVLVLCILSFLLWDKQVRRFLRQIGLLAGGFLVPWFLLAAFLVSHGALDDAIGCLFIFKKFYLTLGYIRGAWWTLNVWGSALLGMSRSFKLLYWFSLIGAVNMLTQGLSKRDLLLIIWAPLAISCIFLEGMFWGHTQMMLLPPLVLLSSYGLVSAARLLVSREVHAPVLLANIGICAVFLFNNYPTSVALIVLLDVATCKALLLWAHRTTGSDRWSSGAEAVLIGGILFAVVYSGVSTQYDRYRKDLLYTLGKLSDSEYYQEFSGWMYGRQGYPTVVRLAERLRMDTTEDDTVLVWGWQPQVYLLAERRPASRFIIDLPLTYTPPQQKPAYFVEYQTRCRETFLEEIAENRPKYIVVVTDDAFPDIEWRDSLTQLKEFEEFEEFLHSHYTLSEWIESFLLYRRTS